MGMNEVLGKIVGSMNEIGITEGAARCMCVKLMKTFSVNEILDGIAYVKQKQEGGLEIESLSGFLFVSIKRRYKPITKESRIGKDSRSVVEVRNADFRNKEMIERLDTQSIVKDPEQVKVNERGYQSIRNRLES